MDTVPTTIDLGILKAALEASGQLRPMHPWEREGYGPAPVGSKIAHFGIFTFAEFPDGLYLEAVDGKDPNGFRVVAATCAA